jgi:hypothetical protein
MTSTWQKKLKGNPIPWLLESNPWTKYKTLTDLLDMPPSSTEAKDAKNELRKDPQVKALIAEASHWFSQCITRHNDAKICYYKLMMLAEFGLNINDKGIKEIVTKATQHLEDDLFAVRQVLPEKGKGFSKPDLTVDEWHALPCDSPIITYSLLLLGLNNSVVKKSIERLRDKWETEQGWFCHFFFVESQFRKLQVGCQMAGLMALEVFSQIPDLKESKYAQNAFAPLRFHWEYGKSLYYFGRSKKFWTLKYPFVWYNALYLADVLTRFKFLKGNELVTELIEWMEKSQDENGRFKPDSMFMAYKGWDFANKKEPSPWITFLCCRILRRWYG